MGRTGIKRKHATSAGEQPPLVRKSDDLMEKRTKWKNKQRVLVFASRGISYRQRHLMEDIKKLMPHHKPESKMERSKTLSVINEMCEMKNCNKALMFEGRKKMDLYLWLSNVPNGPSVKFLVENIYTLEELKLTGNCLRGSRPILSFDPTFAELPHYNLLKELLIQTFGVPKHHPKSQPFFDHVYTFSILDKRIWFRNFQILSEDGALAEIGPRFVLNPVKIFSGSFGGVPLWENPDYMSPAKYRQQIRIGAKNKYLHRMQQKVHAEATRPQDAYKLTPLDEVFQGDPLEKAKDIERHRKEQKEIQNGTTNLKKVKTKIMAVKLGNKKLSSAEKEPSKKNLKRGINKVNVSPKKSKVALSVKKGISMKKTHKVLTH